jgi:hypothetical protein
MTGGGRNAAALNYLTTLFWQQRNLPEITFCFLREQINRRCRSMS